MNLTQRLRAMLKHDLLSSSAELACGQHSRIPGEYFIKPHSDSVVPLLITKLQHFFNNLHFINPKCHCQHTFVSSDIDTCEYVFVENDRLKPIFSHLYGRLFNDVARTSKVIPILNYYTLRTNAEEYIAFTRNFFKIVNISRRGKIFIPS